MTLRSLTCTATAALVTALSLACDVEETDLAGGDVVSRDDPTPPLLNTWKIFTSAISNVDTLGNPLGDVTLLDVQLEVAGELTSIDEGSLTVDHGELQATVNGSLRVGRRFTNSVWKFKVGSEVVKARLTTVETADEAGLWAPSPTLPELKLDPDRWVYHFHWHAGVDGWVPTCEYDAVGGARTVIYGDFEVNHDTGDILPRPNTLYLGCVSGAIGKAALWGYAPDSPSNDSVSLAAFNTATRIVRGDYCASGDHHTTVGKQVHIRDRWIHTSPPVINTFTTEAVWEEGGGAICLNKVRETGEILTDPFQCPDNTEIPLCPSDAAISFAWNFGGSGDFWTKTPDSP